MTIKQTFNLISDLLSIDYNSTHLILNTNQVALSHTNRQNYGREKLRPHRTYSRTSGQRHHRPPVSRNLTPDELEWVEQQVNEQIAAGLKVHDEILSVEEAATRYSLSRLPEGEETVRIVHIGDYDACPCIGQHVANTSEIPPVTLISSDCNDGILRVRFKFKKN